VGLLTGGRDINCPLSLASKMLKPGLHFAYISVITILQALNRLLFVVFIVVLSCDFGF